MDRWHRGCLPSWTMNCLPYEVKRAHWRGTWDAIMRFRARAKKIKEPMLRDMTPARFDILYVAWRADWALHERREKRGLPPLERCIDMTALRKLLGLAGPTISRTAHRLEELGYVRIDPHETDGRSVVVVVTEAGETLLRLAVACIREPGVGMLDRIARYVQERAFEGLSREEPGLAHRVHVRLGELVDRWRGYARFFGSKAIPIYDTRIVTHLRPHTMTLWHFDPLDPDS